MKSLTTFGCMWKCRVGYTYCTLVAVGGHGPIPLVVPALAGVGTVHWDLVVVGAQPVAVGVSIGEQTTL